MTREERGDRNDTYESVFTSLRQRHVKPDSDQDHRIADYTLLSSMRTIVARDKELASNGPDSILVENLAGQKIPVEIFRSLRRQLKRIFWKSFELTEREGDAMAETIVQEALAAGGIGLAKYSSAAGEKFRAKQELVRLVGAGAEKLWKTSRIETGYDVPYIAGYAPDDPKFIFIDRSIPKIVKWRGRRLPVQYFLNVHERVEKILLDEVGLTYQHAHQIAQRLERQAAASKGFTWAFYDSWTETLDVAAKRPLKIHPNLDMTCYYSYDNAENLELIKEMLRSKKAQSGAAADATSAGFPRTSR